LNIKELINRLAGTAYRRVFSQEMSPAEGEFVHSLAWVGAGTFIATGLLSVFSILGGRLLGPEEYGKFTLIQSIAMFLHIPMKMGFEMAMLKYSAEKSERDRQKNIISTAYIIIASLTAVSVTVMLLFARPLSELFATTPDLFRFSITYAFLYGFFHVAHTTLRSVGRMRAFALSQPVHAAILLIAFGTVILLGRLTFESMVYAKLIAFAVTGLAFHLLYTRQHFSFIFNAAWARTLSRFASAIVIATIAATFYGHIGKIVVAHYLTVADIGIYGAYLTATMSVAGISWGVFNMVFFPTASRHKDKRPLLRRINRLVPFLLVLGIPLVMGAGYLVLLLYGGDYPFNLSWLALFAVAAVVFVTRGLYTSLLTSEGPGGALANSAGAIVTATVMAAISLSLVPAIGMAGAAVAAICAYVAGIAVLLWRGRRYLQGA